MPSADGTSVLSTSELVDLFRCRFHRFVRQQLVEVDRYPIAVPFRGRRKPDGYCVGDGAEDQGFAITYRQRLFLASQKPILDMELTRIRGHLTLWGGGIHHAEIKTAVRAGVPAPDG